MAFTVGLILLITFAIMLILGVPISISIGIASIISTAVIVPFEIGIFTSAQKIFSGIDSFALLAIPFFVLSGNIMNKGGIAIKLINFAKLIGGRLYGALWHTNILGNMLFGSISGSSVAAAAAIGGTMASLQEKEGYDKRYSAAVNIASAPSGQLIPPSGALILFSLVSGGTSISALFLAGYIPGILMGLGCMIVSYIVARKNNYPIANKYSLKEAIMITLDALPSLFLIVIVIGGIIKGVFTATEAAAVSVLYTFVLSLIYKTLKLSEIPKILLDTVVMTGIITFLISASSIMSWVMAYTGIPNAVSSFILSISNNKYIILLIINITLLLVGTFMDLTPAVLIFTPIFLPIVTNLGLHPVHFGLILIFNLCIGSTTPPVGSVLFIGCNVGKVTIEDVIKPLIPYFIVLIIILLLITYIPDIVLFLPKMLNLI
ncbi:TRAP transporter large permease [Brachyspira aalborgi]|uniref:TRAP transporter large permease n=1 Tax=Brachyspira aalborgi TaxID=29522 RepID=UPI0026651B8E|nr:TRAP transporter large permease [Brachyspira aalborgi]